MIEFTQITLGYTGLTLFNQITLFNWETYNLAASTVQLYDSARFVTMSQQITYAEPGG